MKSNDPDFAVLSNIQLAKIDSICSNYESQRKLGNSVTIESVVETAPVDLRSPLQWELIQIEMEILETWDQLGSSQDLVRRFPDLEEAINEYWNILKNESLRALRYKSSRETVAEATSVGSTFNEGGNASSGHDKDDVPPLQVDSSSRFRIVRNLAEGGIGTVFVAVDQDLQREVALKELKRKFANDISVVRRFELEASVTGNLEHPNIVPIYATGKRSDGRPFYAMRLIRGKSMAAVIADLHSHQGLDMDLHKNIPLRDLLFRFVTVCRAVGFAHSRDILHRDLKPSNVMLGDFGETLVVDWGLARALNQADSSFERNIQSDRYEAGENYGTIDGTVIGTPGFMSPEQSLGHTTSLTIASDIYSLGATLVQILTNDIPYWHTGVQSQPQPNDIKHLDIEIAAPETKVCVESHIRQGAHHPLDSLRRLPAALDAICRKATQFEPSKRYAHAELLANDLEAWLLNEPVSVLPETSLQKTRRWARRNPAKVAFALASLVFAMLAMGITLSILSIKNESLRQSNEREQIAAQEALRQRERVLGILKKFLFDVEQGLSDVPGSAAVQKNVLTTVLQQLGDVSAEFSGDTQVSESNVIALLELGDLFARVNTEDIELNLSAWNDKSLSPLEAAAAMYAEAMKIEEELLQSDPRRSQRIIALIQKKQADIKVQTAETDAAVRLYESAINAQKILLSESPGTIQATLDFVQSSDGLAKIWLATNQLVQAQKSYDEMLGLLKSLHEKFPDDKEIKRNLGLIYSRLGDIAVRKGELDQAASFYDQDLQISMELFEVGPNDLSAKRDICIALDRLGNMSTKRGKVEDALKFYSQSLQFRTEIHAAESSSMKAKRELFISYMKCGDTRMLQEDLSKAHLDYTQAMNLADEMAALDPKNAIASQYQSLSAEVLADVAIEEGRFEGALRYAKISVDISKRLMAKDPTDSQKQSDLNICNLKVAKVLFNMEDYSSCLAQLSEVLPIVKAAFELQPSSLQAAREYSVVLLRMAEAQIAMQSPSEAEQQCQLALNVLLSVPEEHRQDAVSRRRVVNTWTMLGQSQQMQGKNSVARQSWEEAKKLAVAMIAENMRIDQMTIDLAEIESLLGSLDNPEN